MDTNKSGLTHRVTAVAAAYLDALGCKPIETEVPIRPGWVADLASYWYPTMTEAKKLHVDRRAREILGIAAATRTHALVPRAYGDGPLTVLVEVKTTLADFQRDDRKWKPGQWPAHICFIAFPSGVVQNMPKGWYGLETSKGGTTLRKVHRSFSEPHPQHSGLVIDFVAAVGIRRDHRTRFAAMRAFWNAYQAKDRKRRKQLSTARVLEGLAAWMQGRGYDADRPLRDVLSRLRLTKIPTYCQPALAYFESLRKEPESPLDAGP